MKIIQINNCHYRRGGADVVYFNTGELLERKGHEVFYFSQLSGGKSVPSDKAFLINEIDYFKLSSIQKILKIPRFFYSKEVKNSVSDVIKLVRPDIAHIHTYKGILTPSLLVELKRKNIPVVITLHDYGLLCPHNSFINGKGKICDKCLTTNNAIHCVFNKCNKNSLLLSTISASEFVFHKLFVPFYKYFDRLIAVSKFGLEIHRRKEIYRNRIVQLYNFYPMLQSISPNKNHRKYFLFYGRLSEEKGIITLLKAWKKIKYYKNFKLKIAGDGPLMSKIASFVKENKMENIDLLGFLKGDSLKKTIRDAFFVIVPSEWYENNPLTIVEAYANGKPVIGSRTGGITEIISECKTGFLFNMADHVDLAKKISIALDINSTKYAEFSSSARLFANENFSEEKHYQQLMEIYRQVIFD